MTNLYRKASFVKIFVIVRRTIESPIAGGDIPADIKKETRIVFLIYGLSVAGIANVGSEILTAKGVSRTMSAKHRLKILSGLKMKAKGIR